MSGYFLGVNVNNGSWRTPYGIYVNDSGTWRQAKAVYVNDAGTWRQVYSFYPGINVNATFSSSANIYSGTAYCRGRDGSSSYATGYFQYTADQGWWTRVFVHQDSGGFNTDSGWNKGTTGSIWANQTYATLFVPTKPGSGNQSLFSVPTLEVAGYGSGGNYQGRWCYSGEVTSFGPQSQSSQPADWISMGGPAG